MTTKTLIGTPDPTPNEDTITITIKRSDVYRNDQDNYPRNFDTLLDTLAKAWADKDSLVIEYGSNGRFLTHFNMTTEFKGD